MLKIRVGIIGFGYWGKIINSQIEEMCDVIFTSSSILEYEPLLGKVDWVIVSSPSKTHYGIVKKMLLLGKNVFCEKPLTLKYHESVELYEISENKSLRLYVDDVYNFAQYDIKFEKDNLVQWRKPGNKVITGFDPTSLFYRLMYHDVYLLYPFIKDNSINDIRVIDKKATLNFYVISNDIGIEYLYDVNSPDKRIHSINNVDLTTQGKIKNPLHDMFCMLFSEKIDFKMNKIMSLFTIKYIEDLSEKI